MNGYTVYIRAFGVITPIFMRYLTATFAVFYGFAIVGALGSLSCV